MPVDNIEILKRTTYAGGREFGEFGQFEMLDCRLHYQIDPKARENARITDIELAACDADGAIPFQGDLTLIKPINHDPKCLLVDVPNRGRRVSFGMFNRPKPQEILENPCAPGDGFLYRHGFALASVGWQFDAEGMKIEVPLAKENDDDLRGDVVCQMQPGRNTSSLFVGQAGPASYEVNGPAKLYERVHTHAAHHEILTGQWRFGRVKDGNFIESKSFISKENGFEAGKIYTLVYETCGAPVVGLGLIALRDATTFLKSNRFDWQTTPPRHAIAFGASQTGRVLRHFIYEGLNTQPDGKTVFDCFMPHIAGAQRGDFNHRFAQPSSMGVPAKGQLFPFAGQTLEDPLAHMTDGLYANCQTSPKVMMTNTSWEYWRGDAVLSHVSPDGSEDITPLPTERIYLFAGTHHINGLLPLTDQFMVTGERLSYTMNTISYTPLIRAVLINALKWITEDIEPPGSMVPTLGQGTLTTRAAVLSEFEKHEEFAKIPDPSALTGLSTLDLGSEVDEGICRFPARQGERYASLVADVGDDLNEVAGIRLPEIALSIGVHSGWNPRHESHGASEQTAAFAGFSVFPASHTQRLDRSQVRTQVTQVTDDLIKQRFVLPEDRQLVIENAMKRFELAKSTTH